MFESLRKSKMRFVLGPFCLGILCGTGTVLLLMLLTAAVLHFADLPLAALSVIGTVILMAGGFLGTFVTALIARRMGLLIGIASGAVFAGISLLAGRLVSDVGGTPVWSRFFLLLAAAIVGGILGVNKKQRRRR